MKAKVIKSSKIKGQNFDDIMNVKYLLNSDDSKDISVALIKLKGINKEHKQRECNYLAFVLEGTGNYIIEEKKYSVEKGDFIFIPKGTAYKDSGNITLLVINNPRFNPEQTEFLE